MTITTVGMNGAHDPHREPVPPAERYGVVARGSDQSVVIDRTTYVVIAWRPTRREAAEIADRLNAAQVQQ